MVLLSEPIQGQFLKNCLIVTAVNHFTENRIVQSKVSMDGACHPAGITVSLIMVAVSTAIIAKLLIRASK